MAGPGPPGTAGDGGAPALTDPPLQLRTVISALLGKGTYLMSAVTAVVSAIAVPPVIPAALVSGRLGVQLLDLALHLDRGHPALLVVDVDAEHKARVAGFDRLQHLEDAAQIVVGQRAGYAGGAVARHPPSLIVLGSRV